MPSLCSVAVRVPNSPLGFFLKSSLVFFSRSMITGKASRGTTIVIAFRVPTRSTDRVNQFVPVEVFPLCLAFDDFPRGFRRQQVQ